MERKKHRRKVETMKKLFFLLIVGLLAISCKTTTKSGITAEQQVNAANAATGNSSSNS